MVKEKQLYDLLILLYRSPEALLKITGTDISYKEDDSDTKPSHQTDFSDRKTIRGSGSSATEYNAGKPKGKNPFGFEGGRDDRSEHSKQD